MIIISSSLWSRKFIRKQNVTIILTYLLLLRWHRGNWSNLILICLAYNLTIPAYSCVCAYKSHATFGRLRMWVNSMFVCLLSECFSFFFGIMLAVTYNLALAFQDRKIICAFWWRWVCKMRYQKPVMKREKTTFMKNYLSFLTYFWMSILPMANSVERGCQW
jgi:hypothetical protein